MIMILQKKRIIMEINNKLNRKVERFYIFGSFLRNDWNQHVSDIDIVCIDSSFTNFSYRENLNYIQKSLAGLPFRCDVFLFTWDQFYSKIESNPKFKRDIEKAIVNDN